MLLARRKKGEKVDIRSTNKKIHNHNLQGGRREKRGKKRKYVVQTKKHIHNHNLQGGRRGKKRKYVVQTITIITKKK